ncbi:MAG: alternative ribosome rescue aminoacyl-tRNA hydrolase ArfB [Ignavibacteria bacterium]|nr:alternative ribosome rescue aminoacyl-tRNA hydrolase ArfB [Ignavibacteria bacterium]
MKELDINKLLKEVRISFSRSRGRGGQNLNKVETKAELRFNINDSKHLDDELKLLLMKRLANKLNKSKNIRIVSQTERTQLGNRKNVIDKFIRLLEKATEKEKLRIKTLVSESSKEKRLKFKRKHSEKKKSRTKSFINEELFP